MIKHYDGVRWRTIPSFAGKGFLSSVSAVATDDVWAVGQTGNAVLVLHWDGASWQRASTPTYPGDAALYDVDVIAPDYVVASGLYYFGECPCTVISLVWDGSTWSNGSGIVTSLYDVSTLSPTDAWGAGTTSIDPGV